MTCTTGSVSGAGDAGQVLAGTACAAGCGPGFVSATRGAYALRCERSVAPAGHPSPGLVGSKPASITGGAKDDFDVRLVSTLSVDGAGLGLGSNIGSHTLSAAGGALDLGRLPGGCVACPFGQYSMGVASRAAAVIETSAWIDAAASGLSTTATEAGTSAATLQQLVAAVGETACTSKDSGSTCSAGYEFDRISPSGCSLCPAGKIGPGGTAACTDCPGGRFAATPGLAECSGPPACAPGKHGAYTDPPVNSVVACVDCAAGFYKATSEIGISECTPAPPGAFVASSGSTSAENCASHTFSIGSATVCNATLIRRRKHFVRMVVLASHTLRLA